VLDNGRKRHFTNPDFEFLFRFREPPLLGARRARAAGGKHEAVSAVYEAAHNFLQ
jgi:hypothetical protein